MAPSSSVKVTCISKQYFILGCSWTAASGLGTTMASGKGNYHLPLTPVGPLHLVSALPFGHLPEGWLQTFPQQGHVNLAAIDMKLVAVN